MRTRSRDDFTTIRTEGQILPPDILSRIVERDRDLEGLDPGSYHLVGQTINEAISRSWTVLQGAWSAFKDRRAALPEGQPETQLTRERWLLPLFRELDYGRLETARAVEIEGRSYPISHRWRHAPIHLVGFRTDLDRRTPGVAGAARVSPHGLVQEFLNRTEGSLWAFLSDGLRLRILRDNASLTRQAYVEFDLEAMMDGEVYPDFVLLWLLCHQSRVESERPEECHLEKWSHAAAQRGTRALEGLRVGVEEAISALGSGFLSHRANDGLRSRLRSGDLDTQDYYRQLLRLVYRLLFLFVAEDRDLLLDPDSNDAAKNRYTRFYSTRKLRDVAEKRVGARHSDLYRALSLVMDRLGDERGCPELGLPALGSFLFSWEAMPDLAGADVSNRDLLDAVRALAWTMVDGAYRAVDYKNLGAEELGSVYESLLELQPELDPASGAFTLRAVTGNERKTTGSYYTPHSLVTSLLDTALDPVLDEAARKPDPEKEILDLKVCDPAVGSGHFLISAAHRIAKRLASVRTGDDEPSPEATRVALRDVIGRCLYGVDVNPMAAELCRVSLWMEALVPGRPLSFLDHHIQVGNSLLGTTRDLISGGIPDDAFKPIEGDDKQLTSGYRKRNREEHKAWESGQIPFSLRNLDEGGETLRREYEEVEAGRDGTVREVREKGVRYEALQRSEEMHHARRVADAWCAAFVWPKREGAPEPITQETFAYLILNAYTAGRETESEIERIAEQYVFFHWHLAFPNVFDESGDGGFDVVLGNPPWEHTELKEQEWFATRRPEIAAAPGAKRKRMISELALEAPALYRAFIEDLRLADGFSQFVRSSGRFPLCGKGRINTYAIFAETKRAIISETGRVGCIVPSGIATDNTTKDFFADLVNTKTLASLYEFENVGFFSVGQGHMVRFALLTLLGRNQRVDASEFLFQGQAVSDLNDPERRFPLTAEEIRLLNPNTRTCPIFRARRDAEITKRVYARVPILIDENKSKETGNPWSITFKQGLFNMTSDSGLFRTRQELDEDGWGLAGSGNVYTKIGEKFSYLPIYESKMFFHYNHRYGDFALLPAGAKGHNLPEVPETNLKDTEYVTFPRYWAPKNEVEARLDKRWEQSWFLGFRDVTDSRASARTIVFGVIPFAGVGNNAPLCFLPPDKVEKVPMLLACLSSFALDFVSRPKVGGLHLNFYIAKQLPVLPPETYDAPAAWEPGETLSAWISSRVLELTYTAHDLAPFARDLGYEGEPFPWNPERRFRLRCELDAAFFHLYGIGRDDADYIMETFPIVKRKDEAAHGEYRTKRVILEIYDQMARATETGQSYRTLLDPPPAVLDPRSADPAPATVTPLRPRQERPEKQPASIAAEERAPYGDSVNKDAKDPTPKQPRNPVDTTPEREDSSHRPSEHRGDTDTPVPDLNTEPPSAETLFPDNEVEKKNEIPTIEEAVNILHTCVPDGEKVQREKLLLDAARELGHTQLTKKVRSALNKALKAERDKGRLRTDWTVVWKARKK